MATQYVSPTRYVKKNSFFEAEVNEWMRDRTVVAVDGADRNKKIGEILTETPTARNNST
jgi:hypothetical protein